MAKTDRQLVKKINDFFALSINLIFLVASLIIRFWAVSSSTNFWLVSPSVIVDNNFKLSFLFSGF